jgi:hypothetical protein
LSIRVVHEGYTRPATAGGWCEAAGAERVENIEHEIIFFRGKIEDPHDVNRGEDEPA